MNDLKNNVYWRDKLSPEAYQVCREKGTEKPFSGRYCDEKRQGTYLCACCRTELFASQSKYDSGSGWPSFYEAIQGERIDEETDRTHGMVRTEITCAKCGSHLGHIFPDGPQPTGMRYCVNSLSILLDQDQD